MSETWSDHSELVGSGSGGVNPGIGGNERREPRTRGTVFLSLGSWDLSRAVNRRGLCRVDTIRTCKGRRDDSKGKRTPNVVFVVVVLSVVSDPSRE